MIDTLTLEDDGPDGMTLVIEGDLVDACESGGVRGALFVGIDFATLIDFLKSPAVQGALEHHAEGERQRAAYERATPAERAEVLGLAQEDYESVLEEMYGDAFDYEALADRADIARKRAKGE